jgi:hypothetical protein
MILDTDEYWGKELRCGKPLDDAQIAIDTVTQLYAAEKEIAELKAQRDELLEALTNLVKNQEEGWRASNMPESHIQVMPYLKEARAAINKATGENNE